MSLIKLFDEVAQFYHSDMTLDGVPKEYIYTDAHDLRYSVIQ